MKIEVFFDYLCPYCRKGWLYLRELMPQMETVSIILRPCEASPRAEMPQGRHSDIAMQGTLFVEEKGGDPFLYSDLLFEAVFEKGDDIEDFNVLAAYAGQAGVDPYAFKEALQERAYDKKQRQLNEYAYSVMGVYAIPSFVRDDGERVDAALAVGVTRDQLEELMRQG